MSSTASMGETLALAKQYQDMFVKPLVDAVTTQIDQHLTEMSRDLAAVKIVVTAHTADLTKLKADQKKALVGYGVVSSALAAGLAAGWTWIKGHWKSVLG
jgi:hypothetical protein